MCNTLNAEKKPFSATSNAPVQTGRTLFKYLKISVFIMLSFLLGGLNGLYAQNYREWQGAGNNWSTSTNWNPNTIAYGQLEWKGNGLASSINDAGNPFSAWRLYFSGSKAYTLSGNGVNLFDNANAFSWVLNDATADQNINFDLNFADAGNRYSYLTNRSTGSLFFGSGKNVGVTGASITALRISGSNATGGITFNGTLSGSRPVDIGIDNDGNSQTNTRVFLNGVNSSYSGATTLYAGTLTIPANSALGSGTLFMGFGSTTTTTNTLAVTGTTTRTQPISIKGTSLASVIDVASGQEFTLSGNGNLPDNSGNNDTKFGKSGAGTFTITGANTYKGQIQIGQGTVILQNSAALGTNATTNKRGIDLGLNVGDVNQANNVAVLATTGTIPQSVYVSDNLSSATRTLGVSGSGTVTFDNEIYLDGNLTLTGGSGTLNMTGKITEGANARGIIVNGGIVSLSGNQNNYSGTTTISQGTLSAGRIDVNGPGGGKSDLGAATSAVILGDASNAGTLSYTGSAVTYTRGFTVNAGGGGITNTTANLLTIGTGGIANGGPLTLSNTSTGGTTINSVISSTGSVTINNTGAGVTTFGAANTYTGGTNISAGTLTLGIANALPITASAGVIRFSGGTPILNLGLFNLGTAATAAGSAGQLDFDVNSTLNLGASGSNIYYFKASGAQTWDATTVTINNWTGTAGATGATRKIFIGFDNTTNALTQAQLDAIQFTGYAKGAAQLASGEIVPAGPRLTVTGTLSFGNVCINATAPFIDYTISNTGAAATIAVNGISSNNGRFVVSNAPTSVPAGTFATPGTATFRVTFTPTPAGAQTANITVATTTPNGTVTQLGQLSGTGLALPAISNVTATGNITAICANATTTLTANGVAGDGATVTWYPQAGGAGGSLGTGNTLVAGPGTYYARVTGTCTPAVEASITISSIALPAITSVTATGNITTICANTTTTLTANGVGGGSATVTWYPQAGGNGGSLGTGNTLVAGPGTYYARVTGTCTPAVEASITINGTAIPAITNVTATGNITTICANTTTTLTANGVAGGGATVTWYPQSGGNGGSLGTGNTLVVGPGTYYARVTGTCTPAVEASITINGTAIPAITNVTATGNITTICANATTTLTANGVAGGGATVTWYPQSGGNGGSLGTGTTLVAGPGTYYARVTGTCTPAVEASITIGSLAVPSITNITAGANPICADATTSLTANGIAGSGATLTWYTGPNGTGSNLGSANPLTNAAPGTYYARVTGTCTPAAEVSFTINATALPATPTLSVTQLTPCTGTTGSIFVSAPTGVGITYNINGGGYQSSQTFGSLAPGNYTILAKNAEGCVSAVAANATINPLISCLNGLITGGTTIVCYGDFTVLLTASASGGTAPYSYLWNTGKSGNVLTGAGAGTYTCTITDASGQSFVATHTITGPAPVSATLVVNPYKCMDPNKGTITVTGTGGTPAYTYALNFGPWQVSNTFSLLELGTYKVNIKDANGCQGVLNTAINPTLGNMKISAVLGPVSTCAGNNGSINATATDGVAPYQYQLGAGPWQGSGLFSGLAAGTYSVTAKDAIGCSITRNFKVADNGKDAYESNNTIGAAKSISVGTGIVARIGTATDVDWFKFNSGAGGSFDLTLSHANPYTFKLFTNDGTEVVPAGSGPGIKSYTGLTPNTTYKILVSGAQSYVCYNLMIAPSVVPPITEMLTSKQVEQPAKELTAVAYPNPHDGNFILEVKSPVSGKGSIVLYDLQGRAITEREENLKAGTNQVRFNNLQKMNYIYRVMVGGQQTTGKAFGF